MSFIVTEIRQNLFSVLESLLARRDEFLKNPSSDFTRKKKISFAQTMLFGICIINISIINLSIIRG